MLTALAFHSLTDLRLTCTGDLWVDEHHTVEDVAIALGQALDARARRPRRHRPLRRRAGAAGRGALPRHRRPGRPRVHASVDAAAARRPRGRRCRPAWCPTSSTRCREPAGWRSTSTGAATTTTTWSRRPSRRWRWRCARRSRATRGRAGALPEHEGRDVTAVTLIDYGAGNLRSLRAAFERLGATVDVERRRRRVRRRRAAGAARRGRGRRRRWRRCASRGLDRADRPRPTAPLLGVCLGMQLLFERQRRGRRRLPGPAGRERERDRLGRSGCRTWAGTTWSARHRSPALPAVCYFAHSYAVRLRRPPWWRPRTEIDGRAVPTRGAPRPAQRRPVPPREERRRRPPRCWSGWLAA